MMALVRMYPKAELSYLIRRCSFVGSAENNDGLFDL